MRLVGEHWEGPVRVRFYDDNGELHIERWQDAQAAIDMVDAVNSEGAPTLDGIGKPLMELPVVVAMEWAAKRGFPWEKLLTREYDDEFKRLVKEYTRLQYKPDKTVHAV